MSSEKLVLIIDPDTEWAIRTAQHFLAASIKTALALNHQQAIEMIEELHPMVILLTVTDEASSDNPILSLAREQSPPLPVICATSQHLSDSAALSSLLRQGAFDCIIKHSPTELLVRKVMLATRQATETDSQFDIHHLSLFFNRIRQLATTKDINTLLDLSLEYFTRFLKADNAAFYLCSKENHTWEKVRNASSPNQFPDDTITELYLHRLATTGQPSIDKFRQKSDTAYNSGAETESVSSILIIPLFSDKKTNGAVILQRFPEKTPYTNQHIETAEIIASQTASALADFHLNRNVSDKLSELQIISSYSENLMRMVDKYDVLRALGTFAIRHLNADIVGFFIVQKRSHEFLHWSHYNVPEKVLKDYCSESISAFNRSCETSIKTRRITYTPFSFDTVHSDPPLPLPSLSFRYVMPLSWDDLRFGTIIFASVKEPPELSSKLAMFSSIIGQTHIALTNTRLYSDMKENYIRTIKALAIAVDAKDTYTHGHSENVMNIAKSIAQELSIEETTVNIIRDAGLLHDIGKIGIPGYILNKPGPLTYEEFNGIMKTHSTLGANIVKDVPFLRDLHKLILYHHEHYDGNGYPDGLKGEQIPLGARILHVADAFEAMTSDRPYRLRLELDDAVTRLTEGSGTQFDPAIIAAFMKVIQKDNFRQSVHQDHQFPFPKI